MLNGGQERGHALRRRTYAGNPPSLPSSFVCDCEPGRKEGEKDELERTTQLNLHPKERSRDCRASNRPRIVTKQFQFKITSFPCYVKPSVVATVYPSQPRDKLPESTFFYKVVSDFVRVGSLSE